MHKLTLFLLGLIATSACLGVADGVPAGAYKIDPTHASLIFRVSHMGYSMYTARFIRFDATLQFDPGALDASELTVTIDATSLETDFPNPEVIDFNEELRGETWLDTAQYPTITYRSTAIRMTGPNEGIVAGALTLHGVSNPVPLHVTFNGGYPGMALDPNARIGFSARASLKRSDFGISYGIPAPGSNMGVGDEVEVIIEAEFTGPAWTGS